MTLAHRAQPGILLNHDNSRDLTGYEDGTENPQGDEALNAALLPESAGPLAGSSFVAA